MVKCDFETIKKLYDDHCLFQRCGYKDGSCEYNFSSLDELYVAEQVDGIILKRDWDKIEGFDSTEFEMQGFW